MATKKRAAVFIDTNILIWAVRGDASNGQEGLITKAQNLIEQLSSHESRLMTSTICLGEFLVGVDSTKHAGLANIVKRSFMLYTYDDACAVKAAWLWRKRNAEIIKLREQSQEPGHRAKIKNDVMIVATALVHGADVLYTNDTDIQTIAGDLIEVRLLSDYEEQANRQDDLFQQQSRVVH
jgi:predicted nucleic acid-binding protein